MVAGSRVVGADEPGLRRAVLRPGPGAEVPAPALPPRLPPGVRLPTGVRGQVGPVLDGPPVPRGGWHSDWKQTSLREDALRSLSEGTDIFAAYNLYDSNDFFPHKCVQNAFVEARPQHPIVATVLEMILTNIQTARYAGTALDATATCVFGRAVHASEEERNSTWFAQVAGKFVDHPEYGTAFESAGEALVKHKCEGCGEYGQDCGATGNNYIQM